MTKPSNATDFATGQLLWQQAGPEWSLCGNLTVADGLIFALTQSNELVMAEPTKTGAATRNLAASTPASNLASNNNQPSTMAIFIFAATTPSSAIKSADPANIPFFICACQSMD